eukprot:CAMPEP_0203799370 /NCGR_PEP_ID=MMETSP0100_2-20121128/9872_1 /ASSEMBLY_ACC=CAM_ASM_000210 /TAXON_ID=96639 /ORGANISM=" , Strain NY0313808BC1" /LENGTH=30 /DNA_ID= /DNA_START= /DNA_END= /DNA_ORIENTATION=
MESIRLADLAVGIFSGYNASNSSWVAAKET